MGKNYSKANIVLANGKQARLSASEANIVYVKAPSDTDLSLTHTAGEGKTHMVLAPTAGRGALVDQAEIKTPDGTKVTLRSYDTGRMSLTAYGSRWAMIYKNHEGGSERIALRRIG